MQSELMAVLHEFLSSLDPTAMITLALLLIMVFGLVRVFNDGTNPIEWWQLVATKDPETKEVHADVDSLGKLIGVLSATAWFLWYGYHFRLTPTYVGIYLIFIAGVKAFSAWLRSIIERRYSTNGNGKTPPAAAAPDAGVQKP